jgi:hypothetical protein
MAGSKLQSELTRLLREQSKARENEVFGCLSHAEQDEYDARTKRIHDVRVELQTSKAAEEKIHQMPSRARPYSSRERDSANAFADSQVIGDSKTAD